MALTAKRRRFVQLYTGIAKLNATLAAEKAGFSKKTAYQAGHRLLKNGEVRAAIAKRLEKFSMTADEATERMAGWSRGNLGPFVTPGGNIDLTTDEARDNLHLLKKIKRTETKFGERIEIELHDPKDATDKILRLHGAYAQPEGEEVKFLLIRSLDEVQTE